MRNRWWAAPVLAAAMIGLAACGSSSPSTSSTSGAGTGTTASGSQIKTGSTSVGTILENSAGHAIYWFAIDTPTKSNCAASCVPYWPPVKGPVTAASGVSLPGTFGTIKRADGTTQATYMGHPLYTYVADTSAGMVGGNGKNLSGGLWWAMTPSGSKPSGGAAPHPSTSTSSHGYGY
jgi:predicted lipoprotein with Yx(FWY)xxD motif